MRCLYEWEKYGGNAINYSQPTASEWAEFEEVHRVFKLDEEYIVYRDGNSILVADVSDGDPQLIYEGASDPWISEIEEAIADSDCQEEFYRDKAGFVAEYAREVFGFVPSDKEIAQIIAGVEESWAE